MAPKAHRPGATGLPRTHSRSSSGGSSKAALNLHITQKDPATHKQQEKPKKNGYVYEPQTRNGGQYSRTNDGARLASRERLPHAHPPNHRPQNKGKNFTIASSSADEDDEWVSSESGAATPNSPSSGSGRSQTPVDKRMISRTNEPTIDELTYRPDTPRAHPSLSRVPTIRAPAEPQGKSSLPSVAVSSSRVPMSPPQTVSTMNQVEQSLHSHLTFAESYTMGSRSETTSPVQRTLFRRSASTRPPSTHTVTDRSDVSLHPHPLIRGQSFGPVAPRLEPLAPLMVMSEVSSIRTSTSPTLPVTPSSVTLMNMGPSMNRRTSVSSACSVATLPSQGYYFGKGHDRNRTLSSMSSTSSSSVQALASLAHLPTTRSPTPQYTAHFPPATLTTYLEVVHPLLPPPYLNAHMSILTHRNPLKESWDRVIAAREQQQR
ncbi:hypothetical protein V8B97DRAFT_1931829 [Scleroderma yunnanense]